MIQKCNDDNSARLLERNSVQRTAVHSSLGQAWRKLGVTAPTIICALFTLTWEGNQSPAKRNCNADFQQEDGGCLSLFFFKLRHAAGHVLKLLNCFIKNLEERKGSYYISKIWFTVVIGTKQQDLVRTKGGSHRK